MLSSGECYVCVKFVKKLYVVFYGLFKSLFSLPQSPRVGFEFAIFCVSSPQCCKNYTTG